MTTDRRKMRGRWYIAVRDEPTEGDVVDYLDQGLRTRRVMSVTKGRVYVDAAAPGTPHRGIRRESIVRVWRRESSG